MGYTALIQNNLKLGMKALGDLKVTVTLTKVSVTGFDFNDAEKVSDAPTVLEVEAVLLKARKESTKRNITTRQLMFDKADVGDISQYATVTIAGVVWKLGVPILDDGFTVMLEIVQE